jgi:hypothetical protein
MPLSLVYVAELYDAVCRRDEEGVAFLIESARASWIPREVREEALAIARLPRESFRAPIRLLMYMRKLEELTVWDSGNTDEYSDDDESSGAEQVDPLQLELPGTRWE